MTGIQEKLLQCLQRNSGGISGEELAAFCGVSLNTARKEIEPLRALLEKEGIVLDSRPALGYQLRVIDAEGADRFFRQMGNRTNRARNGSDDCANYIVRRLLTAERAVSLTVLCGELYFSESSVKRELKLAQRILEDFRLTLVLKRGDGYAIEGSEWSKRLCLTAQHKLFVRLDAEQRNREPAFMRTFLIGDKEARECRHRIRDAVVESEVLSFQMIDLPAITNYVSLIRTRKSLAAGLEVTETQKKILEESGVLEEAERILSSVRDRFPADGRDVRAYAMLLQSFRTVMDISQLKSEELPPLRKETEDICAALAVRMDVLGGMSGETERKFLCAWYGVRNKILFHVTPDEEHLEDCQRPNPFAEDLCIEMAALLERRYGQPVSVRQTLPMYYVFLGLLRQRVLDACRRNAILVATGGYPCAEYCAERIAQEYWPWLKSVRAVEYTQFWRENPEAYDFVISDLRSKYVKRFRQGRDKPVSIRLDAAFFQGERLRGLSEWLKRDEEEGIAALTAERSIQAGSVEEVLETAVRDTDAGANATKDLSRWLRFRAMQLRPDTLFLMAAGKPCLRIYHLSNPLTWENRRISRVLCCFYDGGEFRLLYLLEKALRNLS